MVNIYGIKERCIHLSLAAQCHEHLTATLKKNKTTGLMAVNSRQLRWASTRKNINSLSVGIYYAISL